MSQITKSSIPILIRPVRPDDADLWERLRCELWPNGREDHRKEIAAFFAGTVVEPDAVIIVEDGEGNAIAFAELSVRTALPTLVGTRVGYVEGLYVVPEARGLGVTRALLRASRDWARQQNCAAFASDRADRVIIDKSFSAK
jgi:aminoglycoside 6'-N-acetyltransferase I